jgi:hypothetical protein
MQDQFWYPRLKGDDTDSKVVSEALNQFASLFDGEAHDVKSPPLSSGPNDLFNLSSLLEKLPDGPEAPIVVMGTCSKENAIEHSWDQLGLNLFDLPWFESEKAFRYVNAMSLFKDVHALKLLLSDRDGVEEDVDRGRAREQLKWARCHRFANDVQGAVGHGERDELQSMRGNEIASELGKSLESWRDQWGEHIEGCPACRRLMKEVRGLANRCVGGGKEEYAREVADLDSREYRYARTIFQDESLIEEKWDSVKYVITIDDDNQVEKVLGNKLAEVIIDCQEKDPDISGEKEVYRYGSGEDFLFVESAEEAESMKRYSLVDDEGKDIIRRITDSGVTCFEEGKGSRKDPLELETTDVLACFDLDLDKQAEGLSETLHGGLWVMYGTACQYPRVSRMVVTGYRSQALFGHGAGTHGYLMKPFSKASLENELERAQEVRRVAWYCPSLIQEDYESSLRHLVEYPTDGTSFEAVRNLLGRRLRDEGVSLEVIDDIEGADEVSTIARSDLLILDPFRVTDVNKQVLLFPNLHAEAGSSGGNELSRLIKNIRSLDPEIPLLLLLPSGSAKGEQWKPESVVANYLRGSPLRLQEGKDGVFRKPFWISADGHSDQNAGLANKILSLLSDQDEFDIKYQVLVPVATILGRLGERVRRIKSLMYEEGENLDVVFAPLLPFLVRAYGLSASLHDLKAIESVRLAHDLRQQIQRDQKQNDWSGVDTDTVNEVLTYFAETAISAPAIQRHVTLENWMRKRVDRRAAKEYREELYGAEIQDWDGDQSDFEDIGPLTRPLSLIFGGSTRYEFSVRGSWYKSANERVDDILIVVEFAARSSIVARSIIKDLAVHYLSKVAGEEAVMVQEISTDAHVWSDS